LGWGASKGCGCVGFQRPAASGQPGCGGCFSLGDGRDEVPQPGWDRSTMVPATTKLATGRWLLVAAVPPRFRAISDQPGCGGCFSLGDGRDGVPLPGWDRSTMVPATTKLAAGRWPLVAAVPPRFRAASGQPGCGGCFSLGDGRDGVPLPGVGPLHDGTCHNQAGDWPLAAGSRSTTTLPSNQRPAWLPCFSLGDGRDEVPQPGWDRSTMLPATTKLAAGRWPLVAAVPPRFRASRDQPGCGGCFSLGDGRDGVPLPGVGPLHDATCHNQAGCWPLAAGSRSTTTLPSIQRPAWLRWVLLAR